MAPFLLAHICIFSTSASEMSLLHRSYSWRSADPESAGARCPQFPHANRPRRECLCPLQTGRLSWPYYRDGRTVTRSAAGGDDFDTQRSAASGDRK
jgi:hypothetical protein